MKNQVAVQSGQISPRTKQEIEHQNSLSKKEFSKVLGNSAAAQSTQKIKLQEKKDPNDSSNYFDKQERVILERFFHEQLVVKSDIKESIKMMKLAFVVVLSLLQSV